MNNLVFWWTLWWTTSTYNHAVHHKKFVRYAKKIRELTALEVKKLTKDGIYCLGGVSGLNLRIRGNSALYTLRYLNKNKNRREVSLGSRDQISLAEAKKMAYAARVDIAGTESRFRNFESELIVH